MNLKFSFGKDVSERKTKNVNVFILTKQGCLYVMLINACGRDEWIGRKERRKW
jgi:hypothetical protein